MQLSFEESVYNNTPIDKAIERMLESENIPQKDRKDVKQDIFLDYLCNNVKPLNFDNILEGVRIIEIHAKRTIKLYKHLKEMEVA